MNSRTLSAFACAAVLAPSLLAAPSASAAADTTKPKISSASVGESSYVLKPKKTASIEISVRVKDAGGVKRVYGKIFSPGETGSKDSPVYDVALTRKSGTAKDGTWKGTVSVKIGVETGSWALKATATDAAGNRTGTSDILDRFSIKKHVLINSWQAEARGKKAVMVAGAVAYAGSSEYQSMKDGHVRVEFRRKGSSTWVDKGEPTGKDEGIRYGEMPSSGDGDWRMRFDATSTRSGVTTKSIFVDMP